MIRNKYIHEVTYVPVIDELVTYGLANLTKHKVQGLVAYAQEPHIISHRGWGNMLPNFEMPLPIEWIQVFCITKDSIGSIHKDGIDRQCALNVPLVNCDKGLMQWFDTEYETVQIDNKYTKVRLLKKDVDQTTLTAAFSTVVDKSSIVSTNNWHRIQNVGNEERYMLSVRFKYNPTFEQVANAFDDYANNLNQID